MNVGLFIKDFELGTKVSSKLTELESAFEFCEKNTDISENTKLIIIDLDNEETGNEFFIHQIATDQKGIRIIGYMKRVLKEEHDKFKTAGCSVILPKSSLVKNIKTFIEK
jgi:hypothetical protein